MRAMILVGARQRLHQVDWPTPTASAGQLLIQVSACAVCRTDLHIIDGELTQPKLPLIPGHEIVGKVAALGEGVSRFKVGDRVGVPWLGWTCSECAYCKNGQENLCDEAKFTGYTLDGGYAEYTVAKGGTVVCGGIHMSDIPSFRYSILWEERSITSVANLTRRDGEEFMALAPKVPIRTEVEIFRLEDANEALSRLRAGKIQGAAVLVNALASFSSDRI